MKIHLPFVGTLDLNFFQHHLVFATSFLTTHFLCAYANLPLPPLFFGNLNVNLLSLHLGYASSFLTPHNPHPKLSVYLLKLWEESQFKPRLASFDCIASLATRIYQSSTFPITAQK